MAIGARRTVMQTTSSSTRRRISTQGHVERMTLLFVSIATDKSYSEEASNFRMETMPQMSKFKALSWASFNQTKAEGVFTDTYKKWHYIVQTFEEDPDINERYTKLWRSGQTKPGKASRLGITRFYVGTAESPLSMRVGARLLVCLRRMRFTLRFKISAMSPRRGCGRVRMTKAGHRALGEYAPPLWSAALPLRRRRLHRRRHRRRRRRRRRPRRRRPRRRRPRRRLRRRRRRRRSPPRHRRRRPRRR